MNHAFLAEVLCCFKEYADDDSVSIAVAAIKTLLALIRKSSGGDPSPHSCIWSFASQYQLHSSITHALHALTQH